MEPQTNATEQPNAIDAASAPDESATSSLIGDYVVVNFVLAGICLLGTALILIALVYGVFYSGDQGRELVEGLLGCAILGAPAGLGLVVYLLAGFGLLRRKKWGFAFHVVGAVLAALTCVGAIYTAVALIHAFRPGFSTVFLERPS